MRPAVYIWKRAPALRLLVAFMMGILAGWELRLDISWLISCICTCIFLTLVFSLLPLKIKFRWQVTQGLIIHLLMAAAGAAITCTSDLRHHPAWLGHHLKDSSYLFLTVEEMPVEKANSWKALASVQFLMHAGIGERVTGQVIIYFKKNSGQAPVSYGTRLVSKRQPQPIRKSGNPGAFDYQRYCLFNGITHQLYLDENDFIVWPASRKTLLKQFIFDCRQWVVAQMQQFIPGEKEQGLAEALLIGYKDDLDPDLVQSYANTGVIHVVAISGLHVGLIYWLLLLLTHSIKRWVILRLLLIIPLLWLFSIMAGAQPSVLRSALMFSCMAGAEVLGRRTNVFNTLALSAFLLLCINPFWLWDAGFQLSYSAVLSILLFYRPIYGWCYFPNRLLDFLWSLTAVTVSAQVLTLPVCVFHFHQLPLLFLLSNIVAVPLSSLILVGEIFLCGIFFITPAARISGQVVGWLIRLMNQYIERLSRIPFCTWNGLSVSFPQAVLLFIFVAGFSYWLLEKSRAALWTTMVSLFAFLFLRSLSFREANMQKQLIVYHVQKHRAIDVLYGRNSCFIGDTAVLQDAFLRNFTIRPARIMYRIKSGAVWSGSCKDLVVGGQQLLLLDSAINIITAPNPPTIDLLIISHNPKISFSRLCRSFLIRQVVIDASVPAWKARRWKKDCDSLHIPCHDVVEKGAFVVHF